MYLETYNETKSESVLRRFHKKDMLVYNFEFPEKQGESPLLISTEANELLKYLELKKRKNKK